MQHAEAFYAAFERAGWLVSATWQPAAIGAAAQTVSVRFLRASLKAFDGQAQGLHAVMLLPSSRLVGIKSRDRISILHRDGSAQQFTVHEVEVITGGSQIEVTLKKSA